MLNKLIISLAVLLLSVSALCAQDIKIAVLSNEPIAEAQKRWEPTAQWIQSRLAGYEVLIWPMSAKDIDDAVANKKVNFVLTSPEHFVPLQFGYDITAIATMLPATSEYQLGKFGGVIFVKANRNDIQNIADLANKRMASTHQKSFDTYLIQKWELKNHGINTDKVKINFVGYPQDRVIPEVLNGDADAGFVSTGLLEAMYKDKRLDPTKIKIINDCSEALGGYSMKQMHEELVTIKKVLEGKEGLCH